MGSEFSNIRDEKIIITSKPESCHEVTVGISGSNQK